LLNLYEHNFLIVKEHEINNVIEKAIYEDDLKFVSIFMEEKGMPAKDQKTLWSKIRKAK
jgi:hypothetical protein